MFCTHCGAEIPNGADYCTKCACPSKTGKAFCYNCGEQTKAEQVFCLKCGKAIKKSKSHIKLTAGLLAIFLGAFGAHKFYMGRRGLGILYLIFFWTCIPSIIGLIEGIIYLTMPDEAFDEKYNK